MGAKRAGQRHVRVLTQNNTGTYSVSIPIETVRNLRWQRGQKVTIRQQGKKLVIEDWES